MKHYVGSVLLRFVVIVFMALVLTPGFSLADPGNQYCITPAFITAGIKPNMLLMIDNSASMYDLAYVDKGKKHCSVSTSKSCFADTDCYYCSNNTSQACSQSSDCPSGGTCTTSETCSVFDRQPFYCYDETYSSANSYYGYFNKDTFYYYRSATDDFAAASGTTLATVIAASPSTCGTGATNTTKTIANTMCLEYVPGATKTLVAFVAKGNYLNWLTSSKFDIEKQILTGGKFDGTGMIPQSRGCVGQGFVKDALTGDFVNFTDSQVDPNTSLQVTFTVTGEGNPNNPTAPSTGGQTYINLFGGKDFNYGDCQDAIQALATGGNADIKQTVDACLASTGTADGYCSHIPTAPSGKTQLSGIACGTNADCLLNTGKASTAYVCEYNLSKSCSGPTDTSCAVPARSSCSVDPTIACTSDTQCVFTIPTVNGTCSTDKTKYSPLPGKNVSPAAGRACTSDSACNFTSKGTSYTALTGACVGYVAGSTSNKGPCISTSAADYGPCTANYVGDCVLTAQAAAVKTKVSFQQSMQECWKIRGQTHTAADNWGFANVNTIKQQCPDIYASYKTCHNNHLLQCSSNTDCAADGTVTCDSGPDAIAPGNPALLCGSNYAGQYYQKDSSGNWVMKSTATDLDLAGAEYRFCGDITAPPTTDPTDAPSNTATTDNLPAIVSGLGVEAQLGSPIKTMRAKIATTTEPTGLIQQFGNQIRLGLMTFNRYGAASETSLVGVGIPKVCSNDTTKVCTQNIDCGGTNTCGATTADTTNLDGGSVIYPIGKGVCATMTASTCATSSDCTSPNVCINGYCGTKAGTVCTTVANCSGSSQACVSNDVGTHTTASTLIKALDDIPAYAWTPFSEAFYNAIGYFAQIQSGVNAGKSRTGVRINPTTTSPTAPADFDENYNPSEYRCQQNYILLVSDGSSTADRNTTVNSLASLYASQAGITQTACTGAPTGTTTDYGGNNNLPIMSWIAKNRRISDFSLSGTASTTAPTDSRDSITTYVVFNGESNGASGDCNSLTLLTKTAANGGTTIKQASDPAALTRALTSVFQDVAAKAASGTAASILSNSEGSGANILQAVFYPKKIFDSDTAVNWIGEMQNLWYYVDPMINNSSIREDTDSNNTLNLKSDYVAKFYFDSVNNQTKVKLFEDTNGDGLGDGAGDIAHGTVSTDDVKSLWRAGKLLWSRDLSTDPRTIYTPALTGGTAVAGAGLMKFSYGAGTTPDNSSTLQPYLQTADNAGTVKLMQYVHGFDFPGDDTMRSRTVKMGNIPGSNVSTVATDAYVTNPRDKGVGVWKLGDIISSTPRIQSTLRQNTYNLPSPGGYNDASYGSFVNSNEYKSRGTVYVGANDGMLHAFNMGVLDVTANGFNKATITGTNLGREKWSFIPTNTLPYLKYMSDPAYRHLYAVDGTTAIFDASIGVISGCTTADYWNCVKNPIVVNASNALDVSKNTWRSIIIGGSGIGGASAKTCTAGSECVATPISDPADATKGLGYSSYFALDVTDPDNPKLLWEFNNAQLGYATTGPAIIRVGPKAKNGRWFAIFGSGPTGPIDTSAHQFRGSSNQNLRFFIVDLLTGSLVQTIDTGITHAFSGSLVNSAIDADRWNLTVSSNYEDDAVYVGYVTKDDTAGTWTKGGIGRIMIDPLDATGSNAASLWHWSKVMDDIGPVTTAIARLQDRKNMNLWLYFGTGRYYYRSGSSVDDNGGHRSLFGIKEPCYNTTGLPGNALDKSCSTQVSSVTDQTTTLNATVGNGWKIDLDIEDSSNGAERVVTDTVSMTNGVVFFTSFKPTSDACGFGGNSYLWAVKYDTGLQSASAALQGKALIQLSTGEFREVDLRDAFTSASGAGAGMTDPNRQNRRMGTPMTGKPPADSPPVLSKSQNRPVKRILHIQER